ncbi:small, acid-soluble spore protein, H family [Peribacillus saganii]|uniref:Small, acid-soluble spore protein H n=1 Tax=Peribacillus saganii TaxID=2303992 RepID=A0A372LTE5_9BACI|nr:H-type small acid-soluble spore protein [Peribacillus saganii]RFU71072.1 small, acid-soluble spore protein, H family [Peribacillus saganii]
MDANRVKQILSSSADIHVEYNGANVWIDSLNEDGSTARVFLRGRPNDPSDVNIAELREL